MKAGISGGDIHFEWDQQMLANIERRLGRMKSQAPNVLKLGLNDTARQARKDLAVKAQQAYAVKVGGFTKYIRLTAASAGSLEAWLRVSGKSLPLTSRYFSVQGGKGPKGGHLRTLVKRSSGVHTWGPRAFNNVLGSSGHKGAAEYVGGGQPGRLHIQALFTTSIPAMVGNEKEVYGVVEPHIQENLQKNVERHIQRILGGA